MEIDDLTTILAHDEGFRAVCARVEDQGEFIVVSNPEIRLPETNCAFRLRLAEAGVPGFARMVSSMNLAVVLDTASTPPGLERRLRDEGYVSRGRSYIACLEPQSLMQPPGAAPRFTTVGPSELRRFTELAGHGSTLKAEASHLLWSFRLRSLLFSAYLAEGSEGTTAAFAVFHANSLARLVGPFPAGARTEFVLACRLVAKAWERACEKGARRLYTLAAEDDVDLVKPLGFRVDESFWFELYTR